MLFFIFGARFLLGAERMRVSARRMKIGPEDKASEKYEWQ